VRIDIPVENKEQIKNAALFRRVRQHASRRFQFSSETNKQEKTEAYKDFLRLENEMLMRYHRNGDSGLKVTLARAVVVDVLIQNLFNESIAVYNRKTGKPPLEVAVIASGGYGRSELNPYSDVDIMFLFSTGLPETELQSFQEILIEEMLYPLWDLGLKVGHSFRDINSVMEEAAADLATMNSLLEIRRIVGAERLFLDFKKQFHAFFDKQNIRSCILQQIDERKRRHSKFSHTVFLQAPDIKNGPGGLRDYQTILWMARAKFGTYHMSALVEKGILSTTDQKKLIEAYDFLLQARNQLHFTLKKPRDVLSLETQAEVATGLGYKEEDVLHRIEHFMRNYYENARTIYRISKNIARLFRYQENKKYENKRLVNLFKKDPRKNRKQVDGFILGDSQIYFENREIFQEDPFRIIRVFRLVQQTGLEIDFELRCLIQESTNVITNEITKSQKCSKILLSILREVGNVFEILLLMHELCILGKILPEFGAIECLVQHEFYHRYTADVHVLNTIRELDIIFSNKNPENAKFNEAIRATDDPSMLYIMLLLHDLGKSKGIKGHAKNGVPIAKKLCRRWKITGRDKDQICFIVQYHLEMARFWQKYDIDDPVTISKFATFIKDPNLLRYLFVHNYCDSKGTSENLWSDYKKLLHSQLFDNVMGTLQDSSLVEKNRLEKIHFFRKKLKQKKHEDLSHDEIDAHFDSLPARYFINIEADEILLHIKMAHRLFHSIHNSEKSEVLKPIFDWSTDINEGLAKVNVVTWDRAGLFYKLAGALSVSGLNILTTKAVTRSDNISIDTFYVVESDSGVISDKSKALFADKVEKALMKNEDLWPDIKNQMKADSKALFKSDTEKLGVNPRGIVQVYDDSSIGQFIVEVEAMDNVGLLYQIGKTIYEHGFDISFARIETENKIAMDSFYITPLKETKVTEEKLVFLKDSLLLILGLFKNVRNAN
jgi:[protein-PII] uridylyltransferase